ncbi:MAG: hypothetical protein AAF562_07000 [Pseudomonadota bacterium]
MTSEHTFIMLMSSLPAPGPLFAETQTPLSRLRLDARLKQLSEPDHQVLIAIEQALEWRCMEADMNDAALLARVETAKRMTTSQTLLGVIDSRMHIRLCMAALRQRAAGEAPPAADGRWGYGRWRRVIARNWQAPAFGLERVFPWLKDADRLLTEGDSYALERLLLSLVERDLRRYGALHHFDLEAVVIYVLRWSLVERWTRYNAQAAARRFSKMLDDGLQAANHLTRERAA